MIKVSGLTKDYGDSAAVDDVSFHVSSGRVTGFVGPNGAGQIDDDGDDGRPHTTDFWRYQLRRGRLRRPLCPKSILSLSSMPLFSRRRRLPLSELTSPG